MKNLKEILYMIENFNWSSEQIMMSSTPNAVVEYLDYLQKEVERKDTYLKEEYCKVAKYEVIYGKIK